MTIFKNLSHNKPIALVGLMGCGKSTIGFRLAKRLGVRFYDSDEEIKKETSATIMNLFDEDGEEYFRDLEYEIIKQILSHGPCVLATGGGAFMNQKTNRLIKELSISIWLKSDLETILERVSRRNTRPILETGKDKRLILEKLIAERYPYYKEADITIDSSLPEHNMVVDNILTDIKNYRANYV